MRELCEKEEYLIFINSENIEDNSKEFMKWILKGLIPMQKNQFDNVKFTKLEKIDISNQKEMSKKYRA